MTPTPFSDLVPGGFMLELPACEFVQIGPNQGQVALHVAYGAPAFDAPRLRLSVSSFGQPGAPMLLRFDRVATTRQGALFVLRGAAGGEPVGEG